MKIKTLILLAILMIGGCVCDCDDSERPNYYDITGINADSHILAKRLGNQTEGEYRLSINEKVSYDKLVIILIPTKTFYYGKKNKTMGLSFVNSAYACKCDDSMPGEMGSKEQLSEIKIYSDTPLNMGGNPSELLNQYFEMSGLTGDTYDKFFDLETVLNSKPVLSILPFKFRLKAKPTAALNYKFTFHIKLTNGESYIATTQEIVFN